ncbi:hypothetical protein CCACVL1_12134 [Corchorus capsularis]|uniref:Uncharacterized protein n=1 Tax=Corchorus capsularis TaxID=210143 RepID=A0A1R3IHC1_COCAP|nr:hypothetical protein CCACVL1_12134 [Corchorus capsularis]
MEVVDQKLVGGIRWWASCREFGCNVGSGNNGGGNKLGGRRNGTKKRGREQIKVVSFYLEESKISTGRNNNEEAKGERF